MNRKIATTLLEELRTLLPPTIFFLAALNLLVLTVSALSVDHELSGLTHLAASVGALIVGKAVLIAQKLPLFHRFKGRPLVWNTLWRTGIYIAVAMSIHLAERLISGAHSSAGWAEFAVVQLWLALLLLVYTATSEISEAIGRDRLAEMFFGAGRASGG